VTLNHVGFRVNIPISQSATNTSVSHKSLPRQMQNGYLAGKKLGRNKFKEYL